MILTVVVIQGIMNLMKKIVLLVIIIVNHVVLLQQIVKVKKKKLFYKTYILIKIDKLALLLTLINLIAIVQMVLLNLTKPPVSNAMLNVTYVPRRTNVLNVNKDIKEKWKNLIVIVSKDIMMIILN